jgi:hypothetical protein
MHGKPTQGCLDKITLMAKIGHFLHEEGNNKKKAVFILKNGEIVEAADFDMRNGEIFGETGVYFGKEKGGAPFSFHIDEIRSVLFEPTSAETLKPPKKRGVSSLERLERLAENIFFGGKNDLEKILSATKKD